jgi:hypothetical protein
MKTILFSLLSVLSLNAFADQCAWNKLTDATSAMKLLKNNDVMTWCQNCDETKPSHIYKVQELKKIKPASDQYEIQAKLSNGQTHNFDLAYIYVRVASDVFANVAQLVGCPSVGATTFIQTGPGAKKTAYFYDHAGNKVNVLSTEKEIAAGYDYKKDSTRFPASHK